MRIRILILLITFVGGCRSASKVIATNQAYGNSNDVLILSILIQDHFINNPHSQVLNLDELIHKDTLARITTNFEKINLIFRGGHIAVQYKFSNSRNNKIELTYKERQLTSMKVLGKNLRGEYDGEIRFDFGERFYRIRRIILKKN